MRTIARSTAMLAAIGGALLAPTAQGDEPEIVRVRSSDCADLRTDELQRLLNLELAPAPGESRPTSLALRLRCAGDRIVLSVVDPRTGNDLSRTIPAPAADEPGRERVIALAVSEQFSSAWLDLLSAPQPTPVAEAPPPAEPPPVADPPPPIPPRRDAITLLAGVRARRLQAPMPMGALAIGYGGWLHPHWGLFGAVGVEYGGRPTALGSVHALLLGPRLHAAYRSRARKRVRLFASLGAGVDWVRLQGFAARDGVREGVVHGIAADVFAGVGLAVDLRRGWLEIPLGGGWLVPGPRGRVTDRDPVRVDGGWLGIAVTWAIVPRRISPRADTRCRPRPGRSSGTC